MPHDPSDPGQDAAHAAAAAVRRLDRWLRARPIGAPVTVLDTGIGSCPACVGLLRAARRRGHALRVVSILDPGAPEPPVPADLEAFELIRADPFTLVEQFGPGSFDFVLTQLRIAALREVPRLTFLRIADRLTRDGLVWVARAGEGGLTRRRIADIVERVGASYLRIARPLTGPYFVVHGRKPGPPG